MGVVNTIHRRQRKQRPGSAC